LTAEELRGLLKKEGIETRPFFYGLHEQPALAKYNRKNEGFPVAENATKYGLYLPSGISLTDENIKFIVENIKKYINK